MQNNDLPDDVQLESMLMNLTTNESPKPLQLHPDATVQNVSNSLELEEETISKEQNNLDSTVRLDSYGESPTQNSETEKVKKANEGFKGFPDVIPTWERKKLPPSPLNFQTRKEDEKELKMEEPMEARAAVQKNPSQSSRTSIFYLPMSSESDDVSQTHLIDEACGSGSVTKLTRQRPVNVRSRTERSASDPEGPRLTQKPKEPRPLSAPSVSNLNECEENLIETSSSKGRRDSGVWENDTSKTQNKGTKNKVKTFTQKMVERLKEKPSRVHIGSKSSQDSVEEEAQSVCLFIITNFISTTFIRLFITL